MTGKNHAFYGPADLPYDHPPYGIAVRVLVATLRPGHLPEIIGVMAFILVLNLLSCCLPISF